VAIDENRLEIGNDGRPTHYWARGNKEDQSVIDLTLANRPIVKWSILANDHATGSDHEVIEFEMGVDSREEANDERVVGWNLEAMTDKDADPAEQLLKKLAKKRAQLDAECTVDEVGQDVTWCQEAMSNVPDATATTIRVCARSKTWWNTDIKERQRTVGGERRRSRNLEEAAWAKPEHQNVFRQSKCKI